ncbi:NUDIX hydrolase [Tenacibaculum discolor]|uniref:Hydrolase n=1 Tax=Tenacibaculum discolor TaxID=361581 RepID=A0A2G1BXH0_9FLAO|nr:NUDIX domain-containing protein [Tenacibaculum discolor]MDP2540774.1 NUDIX domain-containing protein [Tenacibaculum discolor]PHN98727.1 hydrolase [Tenacibaculum discolor]PHN99669.1 hydrolase [Rhodobacteraceae bacterium 4F10]RLK02186.1 isopentenyldiphosphate isomerase [Tenacibaculum discolor]
MDELIDIVDENGNYTGKTCLKSEAHKNGYFHPTIHIWLYTPDQQILLQKRALTKKVFPGLWDISVAGHIAAGEDIKIAAIREIKEEIGFDILSENLHKIGTRKHMVNHPNGIIDNEFHHVFIAELTVSVEDLTLQEEEVAELKLFPLETILHTKDYKNVLLPQYQDYYSFVHNQIVKKLSIL